MSTKLLKVCALPQGKGYAPGLNIKGNYLTENGFNIGDYVNVEISENQIIIRKDQPTNVVSLFSRKNQAFDRLVSNFDLIIADGNV